MSIAELLTPTAHHLGDDDLPWADAGPGIRLKVLQVRQEEALWVIRNQFGPGTEVQTHRHTGQVFGITLAGTWGYKESDFLNTAGSYLYEPAHSVHTLYTPDDAEGTADVIFVMYGANLNLDADGNVESVTDGPGVLAAYQALLKSQGVDVPEGILID
jgi:2,4'-dihydroxyacetophenone dioxygenase